MVFVLREAQISLSRIWTRVADSVSYDVNRFMYEFNQPQAEYNWFEISIFSPRLVAWLRLDNQICPTIYLEGE